MEQISLHFGSIVKYPDERNQVKNTAKASPIRYQPKGASPFRFKYATSPRMASAAVTAATKNPAAKI